MEASKYILSFWVCIRRPCCFGEVLYKCAQTQSRSSLEGQIIVAFWKQVPKTVPYPEGSDIVPLWKPYHVWFFSPNSRMTLYLDPVGYTVLGTSRNSTLTLSLDPQGMLATILALITILNKNHGNNNKSNNDSKRQKTEKSYDSPMCEPSLLIAQRLQIPHYSGISAQNP